MDDKRRLVTPNLYDLFPIHKSIFFDKNERPEPLWNHVALKKHRIFFEIEYLERLYEEVSMTISSNHVITIDAFLPRKVLAIIDTIPLSNTSLLGPSNKDYIYGKMPILSMCNGITQVVRDRILRNDQTDKMFLPEKFTAVIPSRYPMEPPYIYFNDIPYLTIVHCCRLERVKQIIAKYTNMYRPYLNCLSCACCVKRENWKSEYLFSDIFYEWGVIRRMKQTVSYEIVLEELMLMKGIEYANIAHILEYLQ
jgi:hypothetical protein